MIAAPNLIHLLRYFETPAVRVEGDGHGQASPLSPLNIPSIAGQNHTTLLLVELEGAVRKLQLGLGNYLEVGRQWERQLRHQEL
jgi:hypothetical protein